jgi:hypothetical protein
VTQSGLPGSHAPAGHRPLALVAALLAGVLCLLGVVTPDAAQAARPAVAQEEGDGPLASGPQASAVRGGAESASHAVRALLRSALAAAGPSTPADPEAGPAGSRAVLHGLAAGAPAASTTPDGHRARGPAGASDRAPPRTAGT